MQNSQLTAASDISVKADSREKNIFVTLAGAFAGGVETPKDGNSGAGGDGNTQQNVDNAQDKEDDDDLLKLLYEENDEIFNDLIDNGDGGDNDPVQQMRDIRHISRYHRTVARHRFFHHLRTTLTLRRQQHHIASA